MLVYKEENNELGSIFFREKSNILEPHYKMKQALNVPTNPSQCHTLLEQCDPHIGMEWPTSTKSHMTAPTYSIFITFHECLHKTIKHSSKLSR